MSPITMKLRPAKQIHDETLTAKENIWAEFQSAVAECIEETKARGRFLVEIVPHKDVTNPDPMVDELRALGYTVHLGTMGDKKQIMVAWRVPKETTS